VLILWGGNILINSLRGTETPLPTVITTVSSFGVKTDTPRFPTATDILHPPELTTKISATVPSTPTLMPSPTVLPCSSIGQTKVSPVDRMHQVCVPAGEFVMGSLVSDTNSRDDERPQHKVFLDAFWIDQTEITNAMFAKFVAETGYVTDGERIGHGIAYDGDYWVEVSKASWLYPRGIYSGIENLNNHPVVQISWNDAYAYCQWADRRLPTEAEWEKAARGTDASIYPWGNEDVADHLANFADVNLEVEDAESSMDDGYQFTAPVGSYPEGASPFGALDMVGNVWEWVADYYSSIYYEDSSVLNPTGPLTGEKRVLRGAAWRYNPKYLRIARRVGDLPEFRIDFGGFRCAQDGSSFDTLKPSGTLEPITATTPALQWSNDISVRMPTLNEIRENMLSIWDANVLDVEDLLEPGTNYYQGAAEYDRAYLWPFRWCAESESVLDENLESMTVNFFVNNEQVPTEDIFYYHYDNNTGWSCGFWATVINDWTRDTTINLRTTYTLENEIFDGYSIYPPGEYTHQLEITVP
jgi:formylglycine-generating enzyme required for sulfatase activity